MGGGGGVGGRGVGGGGGGGGGGFRLDINKTIKHSKHGGQSRFLSCTSYLFCVSVTLIFITFL